MKKDFDDAVFSRSHKREWSDGKGEKRKLQRLDVSEWPTKEGIRKGYGCFRIGPIYRFLRTKVGQKWDDIYHEICEANDGRTRRGQEIRESFSGAYPSVHLNVVMIDGEPHDTEGQPLATYYWKGGFYVHPEDGTLQMVKTSRYRSYRPPVKPYVKIDDLHQYHEIKGIWYEVTFAPYRGSLLCADTIFLGDPPKYDPKDYRDYSVPWHWKGEFFSDGNAHMVLRDLYGAAIYPISKKQCGKKELRFIRSELAKQNTRKAG